MRITNCIIFNFISFFLFIHLSLTGSYGKEPEITDVLMTHSAKDLVISFKMKSNFNKKLIETILSGIPVNFNFSVKLIKQKSLWFDSVLSSFTLSHLVKKDPLKEEYYIYLNEKDSNPITTASFEKAKIIICSLEKVPVIPLSFLKGGERLTIKIKASAESKRPLFLIHFLPFFNLWKNFETDWYTETFQFKSN
ncbi:MAG: DUF4390 domain-containing protein [Thermodesulfobacteriota bacterium]|nr:DUF4390 domain-containing protein [Thermodesulfobacteriota bacterium]